MQFYVIVDEKGVMERLSSRIYKTRGGALSGMKWLKYRYKYSRPNWNLSIKMLKGEIVDPPVEVKVRIPADKSVGILNQLRAVPGVEILP
jgi:hypothetical protein